MQALNESVTTYTEDMAQLFTCADASMPDKKARHLTQGVKQEIFVSLIRNPPTTLANFLAEACITMKGNQQLTRHYNRNVTALSSSIPNVTVRDGQLGVSDMSDLRELISAVIRAPENADGLAPGRATF